MFVEKLRKQISKKKSLLCIGLDPDREKLPEILKYEKEAFFLFCREIVDSTSDFAISYKPNIAFFERFGSKGIAEFERLVLYIRETHPEIPIVADVKRGDLFNTAKEYAAYYLADLQVDALTLSPYMGKDSLSPYLSYKGKFAFILCLTSNTGSNDLQKLKIVDSNAYLYEETANFVSRLNQEFPDSCGLVVGGTHPQELSNLRQKHPDLYFLIPGYGAQGGSLEDIYRASGLNS